jgi:hypothetical protein
MYEKVLREFIALSPEGQTRTPAAKKYRAEK